MLPSRPGVAGLTDATGGGAVTSLPLFGVSSVAASVHRLPVSAGEGMATNGSTGAGCIPDAFISRRHLGGGRRIAAAAAEDLLYSAALYRSALQRERTAATGGE